jgi:DNA polymerase-3 subunit gamma/tau
MLLSQQAQLVRLDSQRAVVRVAGTWMAMVQSRLPLLEKALAGALGSGRSVQLEAGEGGWLRQGDEVPQAEVARPTDATPSREGEASGFEQAEEVAPEQSLVKDPGDLLVRLEDKTRLLADFFNGKVVDNVDDSAA